MCDHCEAFDRSEELTEENTPHMIDESTAVALHAAAAYSNGWFKGAQGLVADMLAKWQAAAALRMAYVWGAARFFLPAPPDGPELATGYDAMAARVRDITGGEPDPAHIGHLVGVNDRAVTVVREISVQSSKGELEEVARILGELGDSELEGCVMSMLMAEAGLRLRHSRDTDDDRAHALFMAHVRADLPDDEDEGQGGDAVG